MTAQADLRQPADPVGLRERKKLTTRRQLISESQRLFLERGYRATTLEDIAAAVPVTVQTLLRYFRTKEDLALALEHLTYERLRAALDERPKGRSVLAVWTSFMQDIVSQWRVDPALHDYLMFLQSDPALQARLLAIMDDFEELLASRLAAEAGIDPDLDIRPWQAATIALHTAKRLHRMWAKHPESIDLSAALHATGRRAELIMRPARRAPSRA